MNYRFKYLLLSIFVCSSGTNAIADGSIQSIQTKVTPPVSLVTVADKPVQQLADVKEFVAPLGTVMGAELIRQKLINHLVNSSAITIVDSPDQADAILVGAAELDINFNCNSLSSYSAELVVRLVGSNKQVLWTDETLSKSGIMKDVRTNIASSNVVDKIIKDLTEAIEMGKTK